MTDSELKKAVINALREHNVEIENVVIKVRNGYIYLEGEVEHPSQRDFIGKTLMRRYIRGLKGVCNLMTIGKYKKGLLAGD